MLKLARGCAYVSQFYAAFIEGDSHYMVMEYVPGGDLLKTVQQCMAAKVCVRERETMTVGSICI
jgi:serine/threonine protein kinase